MLRRFLGSFNATHFTIMFVAVLLVPGAVIAAVNYQAVAIVDPSTGTVSRIDTGRRLYVFDPIAGYRNNPANAVNIVASNYGTRCEVEMQYKVPAGKALILTSLSGYSTYLDKAQSGFYLYSGAACSGNLLLSHFTNVSTTEKFGPFSIDLGSGIPVPAGSTLSVSSMSNYGYTYMRGYLVPASAVPTASSADAAHQGQDMTSAEVVAKARRSN